MVDFLKKITGTHLGILVISLFFTAQCYAGPTDDNHIHVEQVGTDGDNLSLTVNQLGYGNFIEFSMHMQATLSIYHKLVVVTQYHGYHTGVQVKAGVVM